MRRLHPLRRSGTGDRQTGATFATRRSGTSLMSDQLSDFDPTYQTTDVDNHGHAVGVNPDWCGHPSRHGVEEVRGSNPLSSTASDQDLPSRRHRRAVVSDRLIYTASRVGTLVAILEELIDD
jgi:hypothetical protein